MRLRFVFFFIIIAGMVSSCETDTLTTAYTGDGQNNTAFNSSIRWFSDEEDQWDNPVTTTYYDHQNFVHNVQGNWDQLVGKNGSLKINGNQFRLIDPDLGLDVNGAFTLDNVHGFFGNGNVFDFIGTISGKRTHLQMILETDSILRIGIFIYSNGKQTTKIVVFKKMQ
ncbi:hypothetical protein [Flavobacterium sp. CAU 1735]|uniref:hypothetical protein n=1 Tax=Flavobacterium sp. CAU 1735 TaxID=3140361 RepID=UPI0032605195